MFMQKLIADLMIFRDTVHRKIRLGISPFTRFLARQGYVKMMFDEERLFVEPLYNPIQTEQRVYI